jgi:hypothetical protein
VLNGETITGDRKMSEQTPYQTLGVTENTSFEEIQAAKQRLNQQYEGNPQAIAQVDAAYDAIIMERLRLRQEGKIKVPETIRFPEKLTPIPSSPKLSNFSQSPSWLQNLIDQPSQQDILWSVGIFSGLGAIAIFAQPSLISLLLAGGLCANVYLLNRKEKKFGKAVLISIVSLILGAVLGSVIGNFIPIDPNQITAIATFILFGIVSIFLK